MAARGARQGMLHADRLFVGICRIRAQPVGALIGFALAARAGLRLPAGKIGAQLRGKALLALVIALAGGG